MKTTRFTTKTRTMDDARRFIVDTITKHFGGAMMAVAGARYVVVVEAQRNQLVFRLMRRREFDTGAADGASV